MTKNVILPKQGLQMEEGMITKWLKKPGDKVKEGEPLFEMETDKSNIEIPSTYSGTLLKILKNEGETVPITHIIAVIGDEDDKTDEIKEKKELKIIKKSEQRVAGEKIHITPRARMRTKEKNVDIKNVHGSGPGGLIIERDVLKLENEVKSSHRTQVKSDISFLRIEADVTQMSYLVDKYKERGVMISHTDIIIKAVARILDDSNDLGYGIVVDKGSIYPVIKDVNKKSIAQISQSAEKFKAQKKAAKPDAKETKGAKFNVIYLGMYDIDDFTTAVISPQNAVLGVGRAIKKPVVIDNDIRISEMMNITLSYDNEVIGIGFAAKFLEDLKRLIQNPLLMV